MGNTLATDSAEIKAKKVDVTDIVYHGEQLILPARMSIDDAIELLRRRKKYEQETVQMADTFDVFPWDGAHALDVVLTRKFGWSPAEAQKGFFGPIPPRTIGVEVGPGEVKQVPWGEFSIPSTDDGRLTCGVSKKRGRVIFQVGALVKRQDEGIVKQIFDEVREEVRLRSIYRGKAIKIRFRDDDGGLLAMPEPSFIPTAHIDPSMLIYSDKVMNAINTNLFTPITRVHDCIKNKVAIKRGVLLGGTFGTGKTLAATVASKLAVDNNITYVYCPRADELADAIEFGKQYQSPACVIFCEDIDRTTNGSRTVAIDDLLNIIDGIDTKSSNIITVLTTNNLDGINPAMLRPGRLDAVIEVTPPDAGAVEKLLRYYGKGAIELDTDLTEAAQALADQLAIPATIAEVVARAKLSQIAVQAPGTLVTKISAQAITEASETMGAQLDLLRRRSEEKHNEITIDTLIHNAASQARDGKKQSHMRGVLSN